MDTKQHIFKDKQAVAEAFAQYLAEQIAYSESYSIALSGGSTPKILFDHLAKEYKTLIDWSKVKLFWGDERCVPPNDEQSNYRMTKEHLLDYIDIPMSNIFRVRGEDDPNLEKERYAQVLEREISASNNIPQFDLIILGMGEDGHTASIFPHQMELLEDSNWTAVAQHPESEQKRITLTGPIINNAKKICFLATGASKAEKIDAIFKGSSDSQNYPATHINPTNGELHWWIDEAAAGEIVI